MKNKTLLIFMILITLIVNIKVNYKEYLLFHLLQWFRHYTGCPEKVETVKYFEKNTSGQINKNGRVKYFF